MRSVRVIVWFGLLAIAATASEGQTLAPDAATPKMPDNPYSPPPCTGTVFTDVTCSTNFDAWIEQFAADQITGGCGAGAYCPTANVTRAQMAVFVEKAMRGTSSWSPGDLGNYNTGLGGSALLHNASAGGNTAVGAGALSTQSFDVTYLENTAIGWDALFENQPVDDATAFWNSALGSAALTHNTTGDSNTAVGRNALGGNTTGTENTALGTGAGALGGPYGGYDGSPVLLVESQTGSTNTFLGITGVTGQFEGCTAVGYHAYCDGPDQVRVGGPGVTSIGGKVAWSALSDARAKSEIADLDLGLPFVLALRPVSYRYKSGNGRIDMGFVGQDVEALLGDRYNVLDVGGDAERTLSLRYSELIAPLVKAVQEQQEEIRTRDERIASLEQQTSLQKSRLDALEKEMETLLPRAPAVRVGQ